VTPYYADSLVQIFHGDCREWMPEADVLVTDPPYGVDYQSGREGTLPRSIPGDKNFSLRDDLLRAWAPRPALVFGTWRIPRPMGTRMVLVWDTGGALGMGDVTLPWKPSHQEIYVLGKGFIGRRGSDVLAFSPVQSSAWRGRTHPHEKPVPLLRALIQKCRPEWTISDPFMGTGSTLVAAKSLGRHAIGMELDERWCEIAANRCRQEVLGLTG
jgi:site-specific DNA-methyltransferase (adenine-specific)